MCSSVTAPWAATPRTVVVDDRDLGGTDPRLVRKWAVVDDLARLDRRLGDGLHVLLGDRFRKRVVDEPLRHVRGGTEVVRQHLFGARA